MKTHLQFRTSLIQNPLYQTNLIIAFQNPSSNHDLISILGVGTMKLLKGKRKKKKIKPKHLQDFLEGFVIFGSSITIASTKKKS